MAFIEDIESIGFTYQSAGRGGVSHFALRGNRYLTYYCHVEDDESGAVFSWEFAIGEYCLTRGIRVGSNEVLNSFMYADEDVAVPPSLAAVVAQIDQTETMLNALRFADQSI